MMLSSFNGEVAKARHFSGASTKGKGYLSPPTFPSPSTPAFPRNFKSSEFTYQANFLLQ